MCNDSESGAKLAEQLLWGFSKTGERGGWMQPPPHHQLAAVARLASERDDRRFNKWLCGKPGSESEAAARFLD